MTYLTRSCRHLFQAKPSPATAAPSSEQGLTLIECIVAIAVIAVTGAVMAPPLLLATATRLQNQRAEQALQIAQGEVDRIQTLVNRGAHQASVLPAVTSAANLSVQDAPGSSSGILKSVTPTATCSGTAYTGQQIAVNEVLEIDMDGDCDADFLLQTFRLGDRYSPAEETVTPATNRRPSEFQFMVRVYAASAADNFGNLGKDPASLRFTSGEGNQRERPLAVLTNQLNWSDKDDSLLCYHDHADCD